MKITKRKILLLIFIILLGFIFIFSRHCFINRCSLEMQRDDLNNKIITEKKINDSLKNEKRIIENNLYEIEKIARESYGMLKPGEKIYIIKNSKKQ